MPRPTTKSPKPRRTRRKPALLPLLKRFRPITLAAGALVLTFGAGALVGFLYQLESDQPPVQVATTRPEPVRPTAPRIELPRVEPPRVQDSARSEEPAATPPPAPSPSPPVIVPPLPKPTPPAILASMLPPPAPPSTAPAPVAPGSPLWQKNALPFAPRSSGPMIAIVIDDMGLDRKRSSRVVGLPAPLTLAWLPYANDLPHQTKVARAAGHELMVHIPMEPQANDIDPGPDAMKVGIGNAELLRRLDHGLKSFDGYIGVNNHMGSRFTEDAAGMKVILGELTAARPDVPRQPHHEPQRRFQYRARHASAGPGTRRLPGRRHEPRSGTGEPCEGGGRGAPPGLCDCHRPSPRRHRGCAGRVASGRGRQRLHAGSGQHHSEKSPARAADPGPAEPNSAEYPTIKMPNGGFTMANEVQGFRNDLRRLRPLRHQRDHRARCRRQGRSRSAGRHRLGRRRPVRGYREGRGGRRRLRLRRDSRRCLRRAYQASSLNSL